MIIDQRPMKVMIDSDTEVAKDLRKYLRGKTSMNLMPDYYLLDISGMSDSDLEIIKSSKKITVAGENDSILCLGVVDEIYQYQDDMNEVTSIAISDGKDFWFSVANASIGKGASIRNTLVTCLGGFPLASYIADNPQLLRGQTYLDRLPDVVSTLARSVHARAYFTHGQVNVVAPGSASSVLNIPDKEILENPGFSNGVCTLKTKVKGYPIGLLVTIEKKRKKYRLVSQTVNADNWEGDWVSELMLIDEDIISDIEGG